MERRRKLGWIAGGYYWLAERLYHELAWLYDLVSWLVSLGQWATVRRWALDYLVGRRVLEIGFGTGELLLELAQRGIPACGLEFSAAMHRITLKKLRRRGLWVQRVLGVTQQMPFADQAFDTILSTFPASYILDPATWHEVARLLRQPDASCGEPGGRLVVVGIGVSLAKRPAPPTQPSAIKPSVEMLVTHFERLAQSAGLELYAVMRRLGPLDIPVLLAEKKG